MYVYLYVYIYTYANHVHTSIFNKDLVVRYIHTYILCVYIYMYLTLLNIKNIEKWTRN
jgi:hypothetical protein